MSKKAKKASQEKQLESFDSAVFGSTEQFKLSSIGYDTELLMEESETPSVSEVISAITSDIPENPLDNIPVVEPLPQPPVALDTTPTENLEPSPMQSLLSRTSERKERLTDLLGQGFLIEVEQGRLLFFQKRDYEKSAPKQAVKFFREFWKDLQFDSAKQVNTLISAYLICRKLEAKKNGSLAPFLRANILKILEKLQPAPLGSFLHYLAVEFRSIQSVDKAVIERKLNEFAEKWLVAQKPITPETETGSPETETETAETETETAETETETAETETETAETAETNGTRCDAKFIPLSIESLDALESPEQRFDVLCQYVTRFSGLMNLLSGLDPDELTDYIPEHEGKFFAVKLGEISSESIGLIKRIHRNLETLRKHAA